MGWASERKAIESRLATNWATTPIRYENVPFQETRDPFIALVIRNGERQQVTLGASPTIRTISIIGINIFVPHESGLSVARTYADTIAAIFDRVQFMTDDNNLISCQTATAQSVDAGDGWAQVSLTIPYSRDEN